MEEKILEILLSIQKDVSDSKQDMKEVKGDIKGLKEDQRIMKNNIAQILEEQVRMNQEFKKHLKDSNIKYKELDYRVTLVEA